MIRPPCPACDHGPAGGTGEEERGLEVDVVLEIPVLLGDLVERRPATEDRRKVHQAVDAHRRRGGARSMT